MGILGTAKLVYSAWHIPLERRANALPLGMGQPDRTVGPDFVRIFLGPVRSGPVRIFFSISVRSGPDGNSPSKTHFWLIFLNDLAFSHLHIEKFSPAALDRYQILPLHQ